MRLVPLAVVATLLSISCSDPSVEGWRNQPIPIRLVANTPLVDIRFDDGPTLPAVIACSAPLSIVSNYRELPFVGPADHPWAGKRMVINPTPGARRYGRLFLYDAVHGDVVRFVFDRQEVFDLPVGRFGLPEIEAHAVIGTSILGRFAVQLDLDPQAPSIVLRDDIPDTDQELAGDCDPQSWLSGTRPSSPCLTVLQTPRSGGAFATVDGHEIDLPAARLVTPVCLAPDSFRPSAISAVALETTGLSVTAVLSSDQNISLLARSAYQRLPPSAILVPARPTELRIGAETHAVELVTVKSAAIVDSKDDELAACGELARRRRLLLAARSGRDRRDSDKDGAASIFVDQPLEVAIIDDGATLWTGLRGELRPNYPDIDMVIGTNLLKHFRADFDYPKGRTILQCVDLASDDCRALPYCSHDGTNGPPCP